MTEPDVRAPRADTEGTGRTPVVVAIWNPASGSAPSEDELRDALGEGIELLATTEDDPGEGQAEQAMARGAELVVACGGDGTVRAVLDPVARGGVTLGLVPLGTGNLLGSNLGIPSGLDGIGDLVDRAVRTIDLGSVEGEAFAVMAGTGFDASMMRDADTALKARIGTPAYVLAALKHLRDPMVGTTIAVDGSEWYRGRSAMVLVGNFGVISGGVTVFPDASPDDGELDVMVLATDAFRSWLRVAWRILRGRPLDPSEGRRTRGRHIVVDLSRPRPYELDGEEREPRDHLDFEVRAGALSVQYLPEGDR